MSQSLRMAVVLSMLWSVATLWKDERQQRESERPWLMSKHWSAIPPTIWIKSYITRVKFYVIKQRCPDLIRRNDKTWLIPIKIFSLSLSLHWATDRLLSATAVAVHDNALFIHICQRLLFCHSSFSQQELHCFSGLLHSLELHINSSSTFSKKRSIDKCLCYYTHRRMSPVRSRHWGMQILNWGEKHRCLYWCSNQYWGIGLIQWYVYWYSRFSGNLTVE